MTEGERLGVAARAATLRSFLQGVFAVRLLAVLGTLPALLVAPRLPAAVPVVLGLALFATALPLRERMPLKLLGHPAYLVLDTGIGIAGLVAFGVGSPFLLVTVLGASLAGLLHGRNGVLAATVLLGAGYLVAGSLAGGPAPAGATVLTLAGAVLLYPLAAVSGAGVRRMFEYCEITERRLAEATRSAAAAEERARLAREMHDSLGKTLQGIALAAAGLARRVCQDTDPDVACAAGDLAQAAQQATSEALAIIGGLRVDQVDAPFPDVVARVVEGWAAHSGVTVELRLERVEVRDPGRRYELLAILSESLRNVQRHAAAQHVVVALRAAGDGAELQVADDGRGFVPLPDGALAVAGHFGIVGMRERALLVEGQLAVDSAPGRGTTVAVRFRPDASVTADRSKAVVR